MRTVTATLLMMAILVATPALSARTPSGAASDIPVPPGALYRHRNAQGSLVINSVLEPEAIDAGYEIIDSRGRVLRTVEPAIPEAERRKMQEEMRLRQADAQLRRLYPSPHDAVRARDRQMAAMRLAIDYARSTIAQLDGRMAAEVAAAAEAERAGRPVPDAVQQRIDLYSRQIREQEEKILKAEQDIIAVEAEFAPIIQRLEEMAESR
jgi:PAS domain-containing protein